jgi:hypothetical protein
MALADLPEAQQQEVTDLLAPGIAARYRKKCPNILKPSQAVKGKAGTLVIVEGVPAYVEEAVQKRQTFIFIDGIMIPIPVEDHYRTYDLSDERASRGEPLPMLVHRQVKRVEASAARFGGVLKEFTLEGNPKKKGIYFEPAYFTRLEAKK